MKKLSHMIPPPCKGSLPSPHRKRPSSAAGNAAPAPPCAARRAAAHFLPRPHRRRDAARPSPYRAQWLVRQERWEEMAELLQEADENREMTPGAMPVAELMAFGARAG